MATAAAAPPATTIIESTIPLDGSISDLFR